MNLIIDIGNTRVKAGLFFEKELQQFFVFDIPLSEPQKLEKAFISEIFEHLKNKISNCIIASVVDPLEPLLAFLKTQITNVLLFTANTPTPINNHYASAATLGSDRFAAAVGAYTLFPNQNILVIDAGTCIKYNFVNSSNTYIGGAISPGLRMRFNALHTFTSRLPLLEPDNDFNTFIGTNTNESILSGVEYGTLAEVEGFIEEYNALYPDIKIILTGGDAIFFEKRLKKRIFTDYFLIMKGLNAILEYNQYSK